MLECRDTASRHSLGVTDRALPAGSLRSEQGPALRGLCSVGFWERKGFWGLLETAQPVVEVRLLMLLFTREATEKRRRARCWNGCCIPAEAGGGEGALC